MTGTPVSEAEFGALLDSFATTAFRLETRDHYALGYEAADYERFLADHPVPPPQVEWWAPWLDRIAEITAQGKRIARVRILAEPPTDYQRWELWAAPWHAAAGERIGYLTRGRALALGLPMSEDWWLLDDERLIIMRFTPSGEIQDKALVTDPVTIAQMCAWRDVAIRHAVPAEAVHAA